ncbi:D-alanine--D-alanine ligase family protein [Halocella sp. SP3-1]|uniref:D-alanine--D-alanine ligase family protein n=1 Tax=Halocella sp. SP3-1 TaxID=2382161 RepID=UPI000F7577C9|nr:D-alanine--D-alanine ligase family protein [Halocella sp. SP3-1]AZO95081.1 D-alanine--D-alanine ligase [Halocella sp. SP3-1]
MSKLRVGLLFGGRSQEHEVSIMSARSVFSMLDKEKYAIIPFAITKDGVWLNSERSQRILDDDKISRVFNDTDNSIKNSLATFLETDLDTVFPVLHGPYGEDGKIQGLLEMLDIPYVGAGVIGSAVGMDKAIMKDIYAANNIPQGKYIVVYSFAIDLGKIKDEINSKISWPCFVKPANMGSSIGISMVHNSLELEEALNKAAKHDHKIVIEEYIKGRELECSVLGNEDVIASLPGEIKPGHEFYDYQAKYQDESTELMIPAHLDDDIIDSLKKIAMRAFRAIDGRGLARVDFFIKDNNEILVNEINTIPGFTRYSMYPKLWEASGIKYGDLIDKLINLSLEWHS